MSDSRHDHWGDHPDSVLAGVQPENWRAPAQEPVFRYLLPVGCYVFNLDLNDKSSDSGSLCGHPPRATNPRTGGHQPENWQVPDGCLFEVTCTLCALQLGVSLRLDHLCDRGPAPLRPSLRYSLLSGLCPSPPGS